MKYDETEAKVVKGFPLVLVSHNVAIMIAPIVDDD
jgi:hypothetical protein